jgi:hypothetical protein
MPGGVCTTIKPNIPGKMQICELDTSYLEAFFQAASGNESDGERKKMKNGKLLTRWREGQWCACSKL